jgi:CHRD domain-containing protein
VLPALLAEAQRAKAGTRSTINFKEITAMRKLLWICVLATGATLLQAGAASAQTSVIMRATLTGGEETPNLVLSGAVATAEIAVDPTSQEIAVRLRVFNLPNGSTASHIHVGPKGVGGPVVIDFPIGTGRTGDFTLNFRVHDGPAFHARPEIGINTFADALQSIAGGNAYVNIHTSAFPGGEIRGQLSVGDPNTPQFPEQ